MDGKSSIHIINDGFQNGEEWFVEESIMVINDDYHLVI